jgi:hypothetical protein
MEQRCPNKSRTTTITTTTTTTTLDSNGLTIAASMKKKAAAASKALRTLLLQLWDFARALLIDRADELLYYFSNTVHI